MTVAASSLTPPLVPFNVLSRQVASLGGEINAAIARVLGSGYFIHGPEHESFESEFARSCGVRHAIAVGNGTDAIELALRALGIGRGDEVVTAPNAGGYTTTMVVALGATPVFADVDCTSLTLDPGALAAVLSPTVKAVVVTHLYGYLADVGVIRAAVAAAGSAAAVVEDCAQVHGAVRDGQHAGAFGDIATYSFYPTKNLGALGDGGAVVTNRDDLADRVRSLRQYGWSSKYHTAIVGGRNSRLDELQAAVLRVKLPHLTTWNDRRRAIVRRYVDALAESEIMILHAEAEAEYVAHLAVARHPARNRLLDQLNSMGIGAQVHFPVPDHCQPNLANLTWRSGPLGNAEQACKEVFSLPCFPEMSEAEIRQTVDALRRLRP